jgi:hypothetical protein
MNTESVVIFGTVKPDGTLEIANKVPLPPGPVEITVRTKPPAGTESSWDLLQRIWAEQKASGYVPRSREAIDAELNALRDEAEEELQTRERLHEEAEEARRRSGGIEGVPE